MVMVNVAARRLPLLAPRSRDGIVSIAFKSVSCHAEQLLLGCRRSNGYRGTVSRRPGDSPLRRSGFRESMFGDAMAEK